MVDVDVEDIECFLICEEGFELFEGFLFYMMHDLHFFIGMYNISISDNQKIFIILLPRIFFSLLFSFISTSLSYESL